MLDIIEGYTLRAILAGIAISLFSGPLGVTLLWNRLSFFSDSLSHSALLGIAISFMWNIDLNLGIFLTALFFALLLAFSLQNKEFPVDAWLCIFSSGGLALGVVILSLFSPRAIVLTDFLFGDILASSWRDVFTLYVGAGMILLVLFFLWGRLLLIAIHEDLAHSLKINTTLIRTVYMILLSLAIALAIRFIGVLLISSLLIIPAACARFFAKSPEGMAFSSILINIFSIIGGIYVSFWYDTPAGPSVIMVILTLLILILILRFFKTINWGRFKIR